MDGPLIVEERAALKALSRKVLMEGNEPNEIQRIQKFSKQISLVHRTTNSGY